MTAHSGLPRRPRRRKPEPPRQVTVCEALAAQARSRPELERGEPPLIWSGLAEDADPPSAFEELMR